MSARRIIDDQYEIIRKINVGGFGNIYYGWDLTLDRPVAIKEIVQSLLGEKQYVDMFIDEALNTARLNHPNIVQVYSLRKTSDDRVFIIMQYIEGIDLRDMLDYYMERGKPLPENLMVFIISEVCKALEYAHNLKDRKTGQPLNIVHRDLSPSNVMLTVEGSVKLIDFGIAKARNRVAQKTQTGFVKGKVSYMSPEQLEGKDATRQSDIFSLGTVFYELITGEKLFEGDSDFTIMRKIATGEVNLARLDELNLPAKLKDIFLKSLAKDLSLRYQSANEMYVDLYQLGREQYRGEPTSEISRLVHEIHVGEDEPETPAEPVQDQQEKIKTKVLNVPSEPEIKPPPEKQQKQEPPPPPPKPPKPKPEYEEEGKTQILDTSDSAKTQIFDTGDDAKTVVRDLPFAGDKKPAKAAGGFDDILKALKKVDRKIWYYVGGAIGLLLIIFIISSVVGGGGSSDGPSGDYRVWINSVPEGATVYLNDVSYGKTPLQISQIDDGQYSVRIEYGNADVIDTSFTIASDEMITFPNFMMTREAYVGSVPDGAKIVVDGIETGQVTPALIKLPINDSVSIQLIHPNSELPVALAGFNVVSKSYKAEDNNIWNVGENEQNHYPELTGRFLKTVRITSKPQGAEVYIEGQAEPAGQTPGDIMIPFGESQIRLSKSGFKDKIRTVNLAADFQGSLFYELYRDVAVKSVDRDNPKGSDLGATVYRIESEGRVSESSDKTPITLQLPGSEHKLYLRKAGYADTSFVVGVTQPELVAEMRKLAGKTEPEKVVEQPQPDVETGIVLFIFKDDKTDEPLAGVDVIAENDKTKKRIHLGTTNEQGRLGLNIEVGKYKFISKKEGYKDWDDTKTIKKNKEYKFEKDLKRN